MKNELIINVVATSAIVIGMSGCETTHAHNTNQTSPSVTRNTITSAPIPSLKANNNIGSAELSSIHMENTKDGWAVGRSKSQTAILRTSEGGQRFSETFGVNNSLGIVQAFFLNTRTALIGVGAYRKGTDGHALVDIYRTTNGGESWKGVQVTTQFKSGISGLQIDFPTSMVGYILIRTFSNQDELMRTTDGGKTWQTMSSSKQGLPRPEDKKRIGQLPQNGIFRFIGKRRGWISSNPNSKLVRKLYETSDGGRSWKQVELPVPGGYVDSQVSIDAPTFTSGDSNGILPVSFIFPASQFNASQPTDLYQTSDAGHSWSYLGVLPPNAVSTQFVNAKYGFFASTKGLFKTVDGGRNWKYIASSKQPFNRLSSNFLIGSLDFVTPNVGWILWEPKAGKGKRDKLYETTNGGQD